MSHPESDGATEMLEGGLRAVSTGALRMVEVLQRRRQWAARHHTDQLRNDTRRVEQQQRALTAVDDAARAGTWSGRGATPPAVRLATPPVAPAGPAGPAVSAGPTAQAPSVVPTAGQLFPHFAPEVAAAAMNDLVTHGDLSAYLQAHRAATAEAGRAGRTPDPADLHRRAVELFTDAHHDTAAAHQDRADARALDTLRQHLAADDLITLDAPDSRFPTTDLDQDGPAGSAESTYDSAAARERRADAVRAQGYDADTTASALLHDLSFGVPATAAVSAPPPVEGPAGARNRNRSRSRNQQLSR